MTRNGVCQALAFVLGLAPLAGAADEGARDLLVATRAGLRAGVMHRLAAHGAVVETIPQLGVARLVVPANARVPDAKRAIAADPEVRHVERNDRGGGGFVPDDPDFALQWYLENAGQGGGTPGVDIGAATGWERTRGSPEVVVAVLDTGIEADHPEFADRLLPGFDFVNGDDDPAADHPHGVQVTGLLAADADNGLEIAGVDHAARILPVKVLDATNGGTVFDLAEGLVFAADQGADVINMSLIDYPADSPILSDALDYARDRGAVLVACAGNHGLGDADRSGPGAYPQTISVGWTSDADVRGAVPAAGTSSATGSALDVVAPGPRFFSGCSAATPVVAGIASLLLSLDPALGHEGVHALLVASAADRVGPPDEDVPGRDDYFGYGRVDLAEAVQLVPEADGSWLPAGMGLVALRRRARSRRPA